MLSTGVGSDFSKSKVNIPVRFYICCILFELLSACTLCNSHSRVSSLLRDSSDSASSLIFIASHTLQVSDLGLHKRMREREKERERERAREGK